MIKVNESIASLWESDARWLDAKLYNYTGSTWEAVDLEIQNFSVKKGAMSDSAFELGGVVSPSATITLFGSYTPSSTRIVRIDIGIDEGGETESVTNENGDVTDEVYTPKFSYFTLGSFYIDELKTNAYESTLTCTSEVIGRMGGLASDVETSSPTSLMSAVQKKFDMVINNDLAITNTAFGKKVKNKTCREALSIIADCFGGCVVEGYDTTPTLGFYNPFTVVADNILYVDEDRLEQDFVTTGGITIDSAKITVNESTSYAYGNEPYKYKADNEYMSSGLFTKFKTATNGGGYASGSVSMLMGDARIEPLDRIALYHMDGDTRVVSATVPVFYVEHNYDGSLTTTIYAPTPQDFSLLVDSDSKRLSAVVSEVESIGSQVGSQDEEIEAIYTRLDGMDDAIGSKVDSTLIKNDVESGSMSWGDDNALHIVGVNASGDRTYETVVGGDGIQFKYNGDVVASVDQDSLVIDKTIVFTSMQVGKWLWETQDGGNLTLKWGGDN